MEAEKLINDAFKISLDSCMNGAYDKFFQQKTILVKNEINKCLSNIVESKKITVNSQIGNYLSVLKRTVDDVKNQVIDRFSRGLNGNKNNLYEIWRDFNATVSFKYCLNLKLLKKPIYQCRDKSHLCQKMGSFLSERMVFISLHR